MSISYVSLIFGMPGVPQIILIAVVILLLFGGRKIPELMRGLGRGIKEFRNASNDDSDKKIDDKKS
ncbi:MAG: twin-arginine translocase TatA/TatE family subunit [Flavobacteriaceae bacterium]|nr:twin-arginine translocase TatA/TatE family subunit [Flavobacteriaceae bacterium]MCY4215766.1 twin-arginine translocase TatA/TatE family subunit [Flavobacteriaceae bacterium]MCY4254000.1 twin-arginine translocase TatA/TatE family subunit [Flavobacteriaceae bacterium]